MLKHQEKVIKTTYKIIDGDVTILKLINLVKMRRLRTVRVMHHILCCERHLL